MRSSAAHSAFGGRAREVELFRNSKIPPWALLFPSGPYWTFRNVIWSPAPRAGGRCFWGAFPLFLGGAGPGPMAGALRRGAGLGRRR
eukprot:scaffold4368_cov348-Prasinococcus_capsulatus_cf.AAC.1